MEIDESMLGYVRERLPAPSDKKGLEEVAEGSGVPYHTLLKVAKGETADPRVSTVESLIRYYRAKEAPASEQPRAS